MIQFLERGGRYAEAFNLCDSKLLEDFPDVARRLAIATIGDVWASESLNLPKRAAEYVMKNADDGSQESIRAALVLAQHHLSNGQREVGWSMAQTAASHACATGLHIEHAHALLLMATLAEFIPDTLAYGSLLESLNMNEVPPELRTRLLARSAQVVLSTPTAVTDAYRQLSGAFRTAGI